MSMGALEPDWGCEACRPDAAAADALCLLSRELVATRPGWIAIKYPAFRSAPVCLGGGQEALVVLGTRAAGEQVCRDSRVAVRRLSLRGIVQTSST
jgi:hypothetical protein